jgi:hypothetical protein
MEGLSSNFFALHEGAVVTADEGVLGGTIREIVLQVRAGAGAGAGVGAGTGWGGVGRRHLLARYHSGKPELAACEVGPGNS